MNDDTTQLVDMFDLEDATPEEREEFIDDFGDVVMKAIVRKAWFELDSEKREVFIKLLEESDENPDSAEKQEAVFLFLDEHVPHIKEYAKKEVEEIQAAYKENRDTLLDSGS